MGTKDMAKVVVVTGAGRREGIGFEVARQLAQRGMTVVLTARKKSDAEARARELSKDGTEVVAEELDVASDEGVRGFADRMAARFPRIDVLINNAAGRSAYGETPSAADLSQAHGVGEVILFGAWRLTQALLPLIKRSGDARIVNVSSGAGSHGDPAFGLQSDNAMGPAYAVAKAALNALTSAFAKELSGQGILVNAVCPGFTATFPGAEKMGARPVAEGAASVVWAALLPKGGPSGGFFRDGKPLPW